MMEHYLIGLFYIYVTGNLGEGKSILRFEQEVNESEKGLFISWDDLNSLSHKFYDLMDIILIGYKEIRLLSRYESEQ